MRVELHTADALGEFNTGRPVQAAEFELPAGQRGWIEVPLHAAVEPGDFYFLWLPKTRGVRWALYAYQPEGTARAYRTAAGWQTMYGCYAFRTEPAPAVKLPRLALESTKAIYSPENIINGYARAVHGWPNSWRPDPAQPLPQWVQLDFGQPVSFNTVHVSFQTKKLRADAFRIEVWSNGTWRTVAEVQGNTARRRVIQFNRTTAQRLRIVVTAAQEGWAICELRVYEEPEQ